MISINGMGNTAPIKQPNTLKAEATPTGSSNGVSGLNNLAPTPKANSILGNSQGVLFGENHANVDSKAKLSNMMPDLSQEGVKTLFLEQFEAKDQPILDAYMQEPTAQNRAAVLKSLQKYTTHKDNTGKVVEDYPSETYMKLIDDAIANNVKVVGINDMNAPDRDAFMADQIQQKSGNDKYVALVGYFHTDGATSAEEAEQRKGNPKFKRGIDSIIDVKTVDFNRENESAQAKQQFTTALSKPTTPATKPSATEATQANAPLANAGTTPQTTAPQTTPNTDLTKSFAQLLQVISAFLSSNRA
jgi:hypothetical protein